MAAAIDALLEVIEGRDHWERVEAISELRAHGADPRVVPALIAILRDRDRRECHHTKTEAIRALIALQAIEAAAPALRGVLRRDDDPDVLDGARAALARLSSR